MVKIIVYLIITSVLLICNSLNKRKIKKEFSNINNPKKTQLDDSDLMPILSVDDGAPPINAPEKNQYILLQKSLLLSSLLSGIHTLTVMTLCYQLVNVFDSSVWLNILFIVCFIGAVHLVSRFIFFSGLGKILKLIYLSPGHNVPGKSFFSFNPIFGYKYFAYSEQLDNIFGLFDNKKGNTLPIKPI